MHLQKPEYSSGCCTYKADVAVRQEFVSGLWGQAFYVSGDDTVRVIDSGESGLDVSSVLMLAWVMPTHLDTTADRGIIMNKYE